ENNHLKEQQNGWQERLQALLGRMEEVRLRFIFRVISLLCRPTGNAEKRHLAVPFLSFNIQRIF
ncbi:hypothetical protein, partial [Pseudomonas sp. SIMBA_067]|uniref:hypothetical protein n=1 Tax=Pseudomonas sp. SIMBA_067 TaxID=3085807 RepID=UPI00397DA4A3